MKMLELFCGTKSISRAFAERGHEVFTVDWEKGFAPTLCADIGSLTVKDIVELCGGYPDVIWASPDCTTYSIAAISHHRKREENGNLFPVSDYAKQCDTINRHVLNLIRELNPKYWFIENPRGGMRKMDFMQGLPRYTVTYCQYGDKRMKPTDIWTNHPCPNFKPMCKNGDPCHERAPRGATIRKAKERGIFLPYGGTCALKTHWKDHEYRKHCANTLLIFVMVAPKRNNRKWGWRNDIENRK